MNRNVRRGSRITVESGVNTAREFARLRAEMNDNVVIGSSLSPGALGDHAALVHLDYASAGHTGFQATMSAGTGITISSNTVALANTAVTPGTYNLATVTVDAQGRLTGASTGSVTVPVGANPTAVVGNTAVNGTALSFMRSDGAPALDLTLARNWSAGVHTFAAQDVHNAGVSLGTSGRLNSAVVDGAGVSSFLYQPSVALTSGSDRWVHRWLDSTGTYGLRMDSAFRFNFLGNTGSDLTGGYVSFSSPIGNALGVLFQPASISAPTGATILGKANSIAGAQFIATPAVNLSPAGYVVGGAFAARTENVDSGNVPTGFVGGMFRPGDVFVNNSGKTFASLGGWRVVASGGLVKNAGTFTDTYGGWIENQPAATSGMAYTNLYGLYIEEQTRGATINNGIFLANATAARKLIALRDQNTYIASSAAATMDFFATTVQATADFKLTTAGNGIYVKEGTNATSGSATLVAGTVTVSTTKVTANSRIYLTVQVLGTVAVATPIAVTARTAATSFVITSASITDTSTVAWLIIEPA